MTSKKKKNYKKYKGSNTKKTSYSPKQDPKQSKLALFILIALLCFGGAYVYQSFFASKKIDTTSNIPSFRKDSELTFKSKNNSNQSIKIDIEIAKTEATITQGLMYRKQMETNQGMLFLMPYNKPQNFWMKNTYIPLDILFISKDKKIVTIQKNTTPLSEEGIPSYSPAQYVLEVNAGFCDKNGIKEGDSVLF